MDGTNVKRAKLLYLTEIFSECTDEKHGLTLAEIQDKLAKHEISADRKTLYEDFRVLGDFGMEIEKDSIGGVTKYRLASREFELIELKLLADAVRAAKFISTKRSNELIAKIGTLTSKYESKTLSREIYSNSIKTMNNSVFYAVDALHEAIQSNHPVTFQYYNWNVKKQPEFHQDGAFYHVSPWLLVWSEENYYLVGYDEDKSAIRHFRVDKIKSLDITRDQARSGFEAFKKVDMNQYSEKHFSMMSGEMIPVSLECENAMAVVIIDRFGKEVMIIPEGPDHFHVTVTVALSNQFLSWIIALNPHVKIIGPEPALTKMAALLADQKALYES